MSLVAQSSSLTHDQGLNMPRAACGPSLPTRRPSLSQKSWPATAKRSGRRQLQVRAQQAPDTAAIVRAPANRGTLARTVQETVASPLTAAAIGLGAVGAYFAGYGVEGAYLGAAGGAGLRALQAAFLDQTVPFTLRRHTVILPVKIELLMGEQTFRQQVGRYQQAGRVLPDSHSATKLVKKIAGRIIKAVEAQGGGGYQKHIPDFQWSITVVADKTPNAFVLPGGKIVVFTGLIELLDSEEDLLAAVIGHEVAHAVARHSGEKLSVQLVITGLLNLGIIVAQQYFQRRQGGGQGAGFPQQRGAFGGGGGYGRSRGPSGPGGLLLNPQIISIFANLFLQLPFSRRAEAEADLIGLKLMQLAGYDPRGAPETFRRLGAAEGKMRAAMGGNLGSLQCTHPRSETRVQLLEEEMQLAKEGDEQEGLRRVLHQVPYWMLAFVCMLPVGMASQL